MDRHALSEPRPCPPCGGSGWIDRAPFTWLLTGREPRRCSTCSGTGVLWTRPATPPAAPATDAGARPEPRP